MKLTVLTLFLILSLSCFARVTENPQVNLGENASSSLNACLADNTGCDPCKAKCVQMYSGEGGREPNYVPRQNASKRGSGKSKAKSI